MFVRNIQAHVGGEVIMKKIIISILAVLAFSWAPVVSVEQSPEMVVMCANAEGSYFIVSKSISGAINAEQMSNI